MTVLRKCRPCGHKVLVRLKKIERIKEVKSEFGVIVQLKDEKTLQREQEGHCEGYVMGIGSQAFKIFGEDPWCKVGDLVSICKYSGAEFEDIEEDEIYREVNDEDILCVWEGEELQ